MYGVTLKDEKFSRPYDFGFSLHSRRMLSKALAVVLGQLVNAYYGIGGGKPAVGEGRRAALSSIQPLVVAPH